MLYFLVNHKYHYEDVLQNFKSQTDGVIISIPHSKFIIDQENFSEVHTFTSPWTAKKWILGYQSIAIKKIINRSIIPKKNDIIILYSEYEPLNHYIVTLFRNVGARVVLVEDGIPSYILNSTLHSKPLTIKQLFYQFWTRLLLSSTEYNMINIRGTRYAQFNDRLINLIIYYRDITMKRNFTKIVAKHPSQPLIIKKGSAIFVNQPIYGRYISFSNYTNILKCAMDGLSSFSPLYFKFHPREKSENINLIKNILLKQRADIIFEEDIVSIEKYAETIKPEFAVSFFSSALLSLQQLGIEPIFLYSLFRLEEVGALENLTKILTELNYNFPKSITDINPNYNSGITLIKGQHDLIDVLKTQFGDKEFN